MKRMPLLQLIAAASLVLLQGANPARADNAPVTQRTAVESTVQTMQAQPVRIAWDRVGAVA